MSEGFPSGGPLPTPPAVSKAPPHWINDQSLQPSSRGLIDGISSVGASADASLIGSNDRRPGTVAYNPHTRTGPSPPGHPPPVRAPPSPPKAKSLTAFPPPKPPPGLPPQQRIVGPGPPPTVPPPPLGDLVEPAVPVVVAPTTVMTREEQANEFDIKEKATQMTHAEVIGNLKPHHKLSLIHI